MAADRDPDELTEKELMLREKWSTRTDDTRPYNPAKDGKVVLGFINNIMSIVLGTQPDGTVVIQPPDPADVLRCHFCHEVVDASVATFGKFPTILRTKHLTVDEETGEPIIEEKKLHRQSKVVACPKHALEIKPSVSRDICPNCEGTKKVFREGNWYGCLRCAKPNRHGHLTPTGRIDGSVRSNVYITNREEMR